MRHVKASLSPSTAPEVKGEFGQIYHSECACDRERVSSVYLIKMSLLTSMANPLPSKGLRGLPAKWEINKIDGLSVGGAK